MYQRKYWRHFLKCENIGIFHIGIGDVRTGTLREPFVNDRLVIYANILNSLFISHLGMFNLLLMPVEWKIIFHNMCVCEETFSLKLCCCDNVSSFVNLRCDFSSGVKSHYFRFNLCRRYKYDAGTLTQSPGWVMALIKIKLNFPAILTNLYICYYRISIEIKIKIRR